MNDQAANAVSAGPDRAAAAPAEDRRPSDRRYVEAAAEYQRRLEREAAYAAGTTPEAPRSSRGLIWILLTSAVGGALTLLIAE